MHRQQSGRKTLCLLSLAVFASFVLLFSRNSLATEDQPQAQFMTTQNNAFNVLTFNIRYGTANDGANAWPLRKSAVFEVLNRGYDIIGLQEVLKSQLDEIKTALPYYTAISRSREVDPNAGEAASLFIDSRVWKKVHVEYFWLSTTPDVPGSRDWGMRMPRMVTHATLERISDHRQLCVLNTHYDYELPAAQFEGSKVIYSRLPRCGDLPTIIMGDFNNTDTNPAVSYFTDGAHSPTFVDTWQAANPGLKLGTWHNWVGNLDGDRIDFIFASQSLQPLASKILSDRVQGRLVSDHFPVESTLKFSE